jgi:integrase
MQDYLFNQSFVETVVCPIGKSKKAFFDPLITGLVLEVRESGGKTWYVRYTNQRGIKKQYRLGDALFLKYEEAKRLTIRCKSDVLQGRDPSEDKKTLRAIPTLGEFVEQRLVPFIKTTKKSWATDVSYLKHHILPALAKQHLDQVSRFDIIAIHHGMRRKGYAVGTCNRVLILLKYLFNLAIRWQIEGVSENPCQGAQPFEDDITKERYLSEQEARQLYSAVCESDNDQLRYIIPMLILSGARRNEVLRARWDEVDLDRRQWRISKSKSGKHRYVPLSAALVALLQSIPRQPGNPWIFPNPKTGKPFCNVFNAWNTARRRAGLGDVRMHDLRHSFASFLVNGGRSLYEVQKILGHTHIKTTQRYAHLSQETLLEASNTVGNLIGYDLLPTTSNDAVYALPRTAA